MYFSKFVVGLASLASLAIATPSPSAVETALEERTFSFGGSASSSSSGSSYSCPKAMSYCGWTRSCACAPGQTYSEKSKSCSGKKLTGAWPIPDAKVYGNVGVKLGAYCACSPKKIVKYNAKHKYCQASLANVVFLADASLGAEIGLYAGAEINVGAGVSVGLKAVLGGLNGLYVKTAADAAVLFNTDKFGLSVGVNGVVGGVASGILGTLRGITCFLGLGSCPKTYDCVSYCTKGCQNYIDVKGKVGGYLQGLIGFCILPDAVLTINAAGKIVHTAVEKLLCIVGNIIKSLLSTFDCGCN